MKVARVFLKSFGCSANLADSEALAGCLAQAGYELTKSASSADVIIFNTCAVKGPTENRILNALRRVDPKKKLIVAGCLPLISFERLYKETRFNGAVGPAVGNRIVDVVKRVLGDETVVELDGSLNFGPELNLPRLRSNPVVSIIPVSYGCLGSCAYCCVVFARGRLRSCSIEEIKNRLERDLATGAREFWVTAQDMGCYGKDIGTDLSKLLTALTAVEGDFRIRLGMMAPNMVKENLTDLIEAFKHEKVFKFLHLPVQSGDNQILKQMRRSYTVENFILSVDAFRKTFPEITLATDIICGFPGESRNAFEKTLELIDVIKPDIVNVSKFFARPGTAAAKMREDFVDLLEIKKRSTKAAQLAKRISLEKNQKWIGWTGNVLIDEKGKIPGSWIGRNFAYKPIAIKSSEELQGKTLRVIIDKAFSTHLRGTEQ